MTRTLKQKARIPPTNGEIMVPKTKNGVPTRAWFRLSRLLESRPMAYLVREGKGWRAIDTVPPRNFYYNNPAELYEPLWSAATVNRLIKMATFQVLEHDEDGRPLRVKHYRGAVK